MWGTAGQRLQQAYRYIQLGQRQQAIGVLTALLAEDPDNADAWWLMANAASRPQNIRQALEQVLRLRPDDTRARHMLDNLESGYVLVKDKPTWADYRLPGQGGYQPQIKSYSALPAPEQVVRPLAVRADSQPVVIAAPRQPPARPQTGVGINPFTAIVVFLATCGLLGCMLCGVGTLNTFNLFRQVVTPGRAPTLSPGGPGIQGDIAYDRSRTGTLAGAGDVHGYAFSGKAGDVVSISIQAAFTPIVELHNPDGGVLTLPSGVYSAALPANGDYRIVVKGTAGGDYELSLRRL